MIIIEVIGWFIIYIIYIILGGFPLGLFITKLYYWFKKQRNEKDVDWAIITFCALTILICAIIWMFITIAVKELWLAILLLLPICVWVYIIVRYKNNH